MNEEFRHIIKEEVKFHEVDLMGVVNNAVYFNYFEDGRVAYVKDLKKRYGLKILLEGNSFFIMARNECNYIIPAEFEDKLEIRTKIDFVKNTSFGFIHKVINTTTGKTIAEGAGVVVHIDIMTKKKAPLPEEFYNAVKDYEKDVKILRH